MMFSVVCTTALQVGHRCAPAPISMAVSRSAAVLMASKYTDASGQEIKAALSAYMHYCQERRAPLTASLKASMGTSFANTMVLLATHHPPPTTLSRRPPTPLRRAALITQVMKELGAEWKRLDAATKARYEDVATADKARFDVAFASNPENANLKPTKKKKSSSGKPKALSAYMHFCAERRPGLTAALKAKLGAEFQNKLVMVNLGTERRELSDAGKAKFVQMAEAQKAELAAQM